VFAGSDTERLASICAPVRATFQTRMSSIQPENEG
jgi:hypothetical protein